MTEQWEWNEEMGMSWRDAEVWAAQPRTTVEEAMAKWMESTRDSEHER